MPVVNASIAGIFEQIADLLDIQGANSLRIRTYRYAARTIGGLPADVVISCASCHRTKIRPHLTQKKVSLDG